MSTSAPPLDTENQNRHLSILGIRGIPACHGGFETFAEKLALFLVARDWQVTVYCQEQGSGAIHESVWRGINRVHVPTIISGSAGSIVFDFKSIIHSSSKNEIFLVLGYNTAIFNVLHRVLGKSLVINMDGIEWQRLKWGRLARAWFWVNERIACMIGSHLVADNPGIEAHLATRVPNERITMIAYGANEILSADERFLSELQLEKYGYVLVVARVEPENSILEIVEAFSQKIRNLLLVVIGDIDTDSNTYHRSVISAAGKEVLFPGSIYDQEKMAAVRFYSKCYVHGHQVGGTNPSLVEALGAGSAVLARDNVYNRWVAKDAALYFDSISDACLAFDNLFSDGHLLEQLRSNARATFKQRFEWEGILEEYEQLLSRYLPNAV